LIAGELVINAVEHARTVLTLQLKLGWHYLYVTVAEESAAAPVIVRAGRDGGIGLLGSNPLRTSGVTCSGLAASWSGPHCHGRR